MTNPKIKSFLKNRYIQDMELGKYYLVNKQGPYKFIKVTNKGYNFLDEGIDEVAYRGKHYYKAGENLWFFPNWLEVVKYNGYEEV